MGAKSAWPRDVFSHNDCESSKKSHLMTLMPTQQAERVSSSSLMKIEKASSVYQSLTFYSPTTVPAASAGTDACILHLILGAMSTSLFLLCLPFTPTSIQYMPHPTFICQGADGINFFPKSSTANSGPGHRHA